MNRYRIFVRRPFCIFGCMILLVIYLSTRSVLEESNSIDESVCGKAVNVLGYVEDYSIKDGNLKIYLKDVTVYINQGENTKQFSISGVIVNLSVPEYQSLYIKQGVRIKVKGIYTPFEPQYNEGGFDARLYYRIRGYNAQIKRGRIIGLSYEYNIVKESLRQFRNICESILDENLDSDSSHILSAMLLGDKTELDGSVKELYQNAGISHVLALSGLHIATIGLGLLKLLKKLGIKNAASSIISSVIVFAYAIMTGYSVSTIRALIMFMLGVAATCLNRSYDLLTAAVLSALIIAAYNPYYLYDTGFLLSFGAIIGIGCVYPTLEKICRINTNRRPGEDDKSIRIKLIKYIDKIRQSILVSISITITTMPVVAYSFYQLPLYSVFLNLIVIPLMTFILLSGVVGIICGCIIAGNIPFVDVIFQSAGDICFKITSDILKIYYDLCIFSTGIRGNLKIIGKPNAYQMAIYITLVVFAILILENNSHIKIHDKESDEHSYYVVDRKKRRLYKKRRIAGGIIAVFVFGIAFYAIATHKRAMLEIRNIAVGQGDSTLICGRNIPTILIDGGSSDVKTVAKLRILPVIKANAINTIDYCFITHFDSDHYNGIVEMLNENSGIRIDSLIISGWSYNNCRDLIDKELKELCNNKGTKILVMNKGDELVLGELKLKCLNPGHHNYNDINDSSLVLKLSCGEFTALFPGDISTNTEEELIEEVNKVNYFKLAHHGSKHSNCEKLLNKLQPDICVASSGVNNSYGHPNLETIERVRGTKSSVFRTDEEGEIITIVKNSDIVVRKWIN